MWGHLLNSFIFEMPGARNRLASKQQGPGIPCKICSKMDGENWLQCENCDGWTHSSCMGYTKEEFDFLERAKNVHFFCETCPVTSKKVTASLTSDVASLTKSVETMKKTLNDMMTTKPPSSADTQDKYKNSNTSKLFDQELRFSGLPELKFQKRELIKENGEKHFTKPDRKLIFEHEENLRSCQLLGH